MSDLTEFGSLLAEFYDQTEPQQMLQRVVDTAVQLIDCSAAATALLRDHVTIEKAAFTSDISKRAALLQLELDGGPCLTAMREGGHVRIDDTSTDGRWPRWSAAVAELGVRSSISVSLASGDPRSVGTLFVYAPRVDAFDEEDVATVRILASHAAVAVRQNRREANMQRALDSRTVIGQAEGIVMAKYNVTADQAFAVLTRCSQLGNVKLREVAGHVVRRRELPGIADASMSAAAG